MYRTNCLKSFTCFCNCSTYAVSTKTCNCFDICFIPSNANFCILTSVIDTCHFFWKCFFDICFFCRICFHSYSLYIIQGFWSTCSCLYIFEYIQRRKWRSIKIKHRLIVYLRTTPAICCYIWIIICTIFCCPSRTFFFPDRFILC